MRLENIIYLAWRNLWLHRLRAILTIGGVTLGVGAIVFLVSIGFGLQSVVTNQVADFDAFTTIDVPSANLKTGKIDQKAINRIGGIAHITEINGVDDMAGRTRLSTQNSTTETVIVASNTRYFKLSQLKILNGRSYNDSSTDEVLVNQALAGILGYSGNNEKNVVGKKMVTDFIIAQDLIGPSNGGEPISKINIPATIVGVVSGYESPILYQPLAAADELGVVNRTSLKLKVDDKKNINQVRQAVELLGFSTEYVGDTVDQISQVFTLFRLVLGGFGFIALLVAALGTFNTLTISLMERIKEVGLLKAIGMKERDIFRLFIAESLSIGIIGGLLGIVGASATGWLINLVLGALARSSGAEIVTVYYTPVSFIIIVAAGSLVLGVLTGLYPAYRAIKTKALDVLRYE